MAKAPLPNGGPDNNWNRLLSLKPADEGYNSVWAGRVRAFLESWERGDSCKTYPQLDRAYSIYSGSKNVMERKALEQMLETGLSHADIVKVFSKNGLKDIEESTCQLYQDLFCEIRSQRHNEQSTSQEEPYQQPAPAWAQKIYASSGKKAAEGAFVLHHGLFAATIWEMTKGLDVSPQAVHAFVEKIETEDGPPRNSFERTLRQQFQLANLQFMKQMSLIGEETDAHRMAIRVAAVARLMDSCRRTGEVLAKMNPRPASAGNDMSGDLAKIKKQAASGISAVNPTEITPAVAEQPAQSLAEQAQKTLDLSDAAQRATQTKTERSKTVDSVRLSEGDVAVKTPAAPSVPRFVVPRAKNSAERAGRPLGSRATAFVGALVKPRSPNKSTSGNAVTSPGPNMPAAKASVSSVSGTKSEKHDTELQSVTAPNPPRLNYDLPRPPQPTVNPTALLIER